MLESQSQADGASIHRIIPCIAAAHNRGVTVGGESSWQRYLEHMRVGEGSSAARRKGDPVLAHKLYRKASFYAQHLKTPRRLLSHTRLDIAHRLHVLKMPVLPTTIDVEPNNYCNFECPHCQVTHWSKPKTNLDVEKLNAIVGQFPDLIRVKLQGMGEPLLNKQTLPMLEALQAKNIDSEIITNGSVMSDAVCDKLLDLPTDICFSIDGATASVFEGIRVASSFDRVVANIRKLTSRRRVKTKALVARTVVTKDNASQLADIVRLVSDLGLDRLTFQLVLCGWGKNDIEALNAPKRVEDLPQLQSYIDLARAEADKRRLPVYFQSEERYSRTRKCAWPWRSAYIASNGDVVPCCILADSDTAKMGNVFVDDFATIWNSQAYQDLRRGIRDHQLPNYCKGCYADA